MRWVSFKGEYAFLSIGGMPTGIVAIGGVARGVVAIGGVFSAGVISVSMNAVGSLAAFGMNAAAPLSFSLINGLGVVTAAGVNGWGLYTWAGVNASGLAGQGGVNWSANIVGPIVVIAALLVAALAVRGSWKPRDIPQAVSPGTFTSAMVPLGSFTSADVRGPVRARATLRAMRDEAIDLQAGRVALSAGVGGLVAAAARQLGANARVIATLVRDVERSLDSEGGDYREAPLMTTRSVVRCVNIEPDASAGRWMPEDADELQRVLAWSAGLGAALSVVVLVWAFLRGG